MSNAPQQSRNSGDSRRRRSRGGNHHKRNHEKRHNDHRGSHDSHHNKSNQPEEFRPRGPRQPRTQTPAKLNWFQKILNFFGLYKPKTTAERPQRKKESTNTPNAHKSNTRNSRSGDNQTPTPKPQSERSEERPQKKERRNKERSRGGDASTVESTRVYVGNLSYEVTEQDLQELFKGIGPVRSVEIVYNRTTHRSKGYGFVEMHHKDDAIRSVEVLNDQFFMGRKMMVSGAKSKGQDDREERSTPNPKSVALAPLPSQTSDEEPTIQTIVETVTTLEEPEIPTVIESPAAPSSEPSAETPSPSPETPVATPTETTPVVPEPSPEKPAEPTPTPTPTSPTPVVEASKPSSES